VTKEHIEKRRSWWTRLKQRLSFWLICRLDLTVAQLLQRRAEVKGKDAMVKSSRTVQT
jgi:hypothetical protein